MSGMAMFNTSGRLSAPVRLPTPDGVYFPLVMRMLFSAVSGSRGLVQLVRTPACHPGGFEFKLHRSPFLSVRSPSAQSEKRTIYDKLPSLPAWRS
jgi:hypothetical protein